MDSRVIMTPQEKRKATIIERHGSWEAYLQYQRELGSKGGKSPHSYRGFRDKPGLAQEAAKKSAEVRKK